MWINILLFIIGLILLIKGADWITEYGSRLAKKLGASELIIGLTIVALATSLPELAVSVISSLTGMSQIATGTVIGSNIANIALILGASALIYPMATGRSFFRQGFFTLGFSVLVAILLLGGLFWYEGLVIISLFIAYIIYDIRNSEEGRETTTTRIQKGSTPKYLAVCILGGLVVVAGAQLLITSTVSIARWLAVPEILIAMIIIAIGTSLPELATSITAAAKRMRGISLGNIIGSNIFNIAILGIASLASVVPVTGHVIMIDLPFMLLVTVLLVLFIKTGLKLSRKEGAILLTAYMVFVALQFIA